MSETLNPVVSLFKGSTNPRPVTHERLDEVLDAIQHGACQRRVSRLRELLHAHDKAGYDTAKRTLHAATFGGIFSPTRRKNHLTAHSGIVHGDLDHLTDVEAAKCCLASNPTVAYAFVSPSGLGLKLGVRIARVADDGAYKHAWQIICDHFQRTYGLTWDPTGKDVCRLCYLSDDPQLYRNLDAAIFAVPALVPPAPKPTHPRPIFEVPRDQRERYAHRAIQAAVGMIDSSVPGTRHHARVRASYLLGGDIAGGVLSEWEGYEALRAAVERNTEDLPNALKTILDGLRDGQARPIALSELEAERQVWLATHGHGDRNRAQEVEHPSAPGSTNGPAPFRTAPGHMYPRIRTISAQEVPAWR